MAGEIIAGEALATAPLGDIDAMAARAEQEANSRAVDSGSNKRKFVPSSSSALQDIDAQASKIRAAESTLRMANPEEIDIDDDGAGAGHDETGVSEKPVPAAVFGSVAQAH